MNDTCTPRSIIAPQGSSGHATLPPAGSSGIQLQQQQQPPAGGLGAAPSAEKLHEVLSTVLTQLQPSGSSSGGGAVASAALKPSQPPLAPPQQQGQPYKGPWEQRPMRSHCDALVRFLALQTGGVAPRALVDKKVRVF